MKVVQDTVMFGCVAIGRGVELFYCCLVVCQSVSYAVPHLYDYSKEEKHFRFTCIRKWRRPIFKCILSIGVNTALFPLPAVW
jgi:hypothetical protein